MSISNINSSLVNSEFKISKSLKSKSFNKIEAKEESKIIAKDESGFKSFYDHSSKPLRLTFPKTSNYSDLLYDLAPINLEKEKKVITDQSNKMIKSLETFSKNKPDRLKSILTQAYPNIDKSEIEAISNSFLTKNLNVPEIKFLDSSELNGHNGAYSSKEKTIYLNRSLLDQTDQLQTILLEEFGHHLDSSINNIDSPGDEGSIFAKGLIKGETLNSSELNILREEDDKGYITVDGKTIEV